MSLYPWGIVWKLIHEIFGMSGDETDVPPSDAGRASNRAGVKQPVFSAGSHHSYLLVRSSQLVSLGSVQ